MADGFSFLFPFFFTMRWKLNLLERISDIALEVAQKGTLQVLCTLPWILILSHRIAYVCTLADILNCL